MIIFTVYKVKDIQNNLYRDIKVYDKKRIIVQLKKQKLNKYKDEDLRPYINRFNKEIKIIICIVRINNFFFYFLINIIVFKLLLYM